MAKTQNSFSVESLGACYIWLELAGTAFSTLFCGIYKKVRQNPKLTLTRAGPGLIKDPFYESPAGYTSLDYHRAVPGE